MIIQMLTKMDDDAGTITVYVMSVGQVRDVAVYTQTLKFSDLKQRADDLALSTFSSGTKLTERDACAVMSIPAGLHYRR